MKVVLSSSVNDSRAHESLSSAALSASVETFLEVEGPALADTLAWDPLTPSEHILAALASAGIRTFECEAKRPTTDALEQAFMTLCVPVARSVVTMPRPSRVVSLVDHAMNGLELDYFAALLPEKFWKKESSFRPFLKLPPAYIYPLIVPESIARQSTELGALSACMWCVWIRNSRGPSCFRPLLVAADGRTQSRRQRSPDRASVDLLLASSISNRTSSR